MAPPALIITSPRRKQLKAFRMIISIQFKDNTGYNIVMLPHERTRMTKLNNRSNPDYVQISFENLHFDDGDLCIRYIKNILINGALVDGRKYIYCGHSNSQLKYKGCYLFAADEHSVVERLIHDQGNFSSITDVSKRAKRIGLLFTGGEQIVWLKGSQTGEMDDVVRDGKIFTDGCGIISAEFAKSIAEKYYNRISPQGVNQNYVPQVFQIRYKGYKGILVVDQDNTNFKGKGQLIRSSTISPLDTVQGRTNSIYNLTETSIQLQRDDAKVIFRRSMRKFDNSPSEELFILEHSKPGVGAKLNAEIVSLLSSLGIPDEVFINKLYAYMNFIGDCCTDVETMLEFLNYKARYVVVVELKKLSVKKAKDVQSWIKVELCRSQVHELKEYYDKNEIERIHIMIPKSRLLFGICDLSGKLLEGECVVRYTSDRYSLERTTITGKVMVARNPCLHPGDIQVFTAVDHIAELNHFVDCIIFPTVGKLPAAAQMSGGDLDGDKFFVTWDPDLIPPKTTEPLDYSTIEANPEIPFQHSNQQLDLINYFAKFNNAALGQISYLYSRWIRGKSEERAFCRECIALNALYSKSVDGESVEIPVEFRLYPNSDTSKPFIVDTLMEEIKMLLQCRFPRFNQRFDAFEGREKELFPFGRPCPVDLGEVEEHLPGAEPIVPTPESATRTPAAPALALDLNPPQLQQPTPIPVVTSSRGYFSNCGGDRFGSQEFNIPPNGNHNQYGFSATSGQRRNWYQSNAEVDYSSAMNSEYEGYGYRNTSNYQQSYGEYRSESSKRGRFSSSSSSAPRINDNWRPMNIADGQSSSSRTFNYYSPEGSSKSGVRNPSPGNRTSTEPGRNLGRRNISMNQLDELE